jgi:nucleoid DNA-binding protein
MGGSPGRKGEAMRKASWVGVAVLVAAAGWVFGQDKPPQAQNPPQAPKIVQLGQRPPGSDPNSLVGRVAAATQMPEADVAKVLRAFGPAIKDLLGQGQQVELANLGTFRVVRIPAHRDLVGGRPATIGGTNYIEFLASEKFAEAANLPGAKPAETVPPFEYNPLPDQTKGLRTGNTRTPGTRTP